MRSLKIKICPQCKKEFSAVSRKYCASSCLYLHNKDAILEKRHAYYAKNSEQIKKDKAIYRSKTKSKRQEYHKKNKNKAKQKNKKFKENNPNYFNDYDKNRKKKDISFKLIKKLRLRMYSVLKNRYRGKKPTSFTKSLGCTSLKLKIFLQMKFYRRYKNNEIMNWANYGQWHIDHIRPLASFDLTNPEEFKKACHYTNLQPLWAEDNLKKGDKLPQVLSPQGDLDVK